MKKRCLQLSLLLSLLVVINACNKDDGGDDYVALEITTQADVAVVLQTETVDISVFGNDTNVPQDGQFSVSDPQSGSVQIINNGTPANVLDDLIRYTPATSFVDTDTFQYTICDSDGVGCKTETVTITISQVSTVDVNLSAVPYANLSEYKFFEGNMADQNPAFSVLPYEPISALFTDYAKKPRFVWMPEGSKATYVADDKSLEFPNGTVLIKTFLFDNVLPNNNRQVIETRLMIRKDNDWIFADYIWNANQTDAVLDAAGDGGSVQVDWLQDGAPKSVNYRIPAASQCTICHKNDFTNIAIGVKPQNLNSTYDFADGSFNQLQKWVAEGYLEDNVPGNIVTVVPWNDPTQPLEARVRSYLDINCANCHTDGGHADYRAIRLSYTETGEDIDVAGICKPTDTPIIGFPENKIIVPGDAEASILYFRMITEKEQYRMPQFGRTIEHEESAALIKEWIDSLTQVCN